MSREHVERQGEHKRADASGDEGGGATATLQRAGNQAAGAVLDSFEIGRADDAVEGHADLLAARALAGVPGLTGAGPGTDGVIRRQAAGPDRLGGSQVDSGTAADISGAIGGGSPLPTAVRNDFEQGLGTGLGGVRVHTDAKADTLARKVDAAAFTTGQDVFFRQDTYAPSTDVGRQVLAHEVAHTVQGEGTIRRLMSAKQFKASTNVGGHMRGDAIKAIDKHMAEIEKLKGQFDNPPATKKAAVKGTAPSAPPPPDQSVKIANLEKRIQLIKEMEYFAQGWIDAHTIQQTLSVPTVSAPTPGVAPGTSPSSGGTPPPPPPSSPPPPPPPKTKQTKSMEDPKRKQRMDGVKTFLKGDPYNHPKNAPGVNKDITELAPLSLVRERGLLQTQLDGLKTPTPPGTTPPPGAPAEESSTFKKIKKKYEGDAKSMFTSLAGLVNLAVPNEGDSVEVDLTAKIPVDPNAIGFILFHLVLSAAHDSLVGEVAGQEGKDNIVIRGELSVGGGANIATLAEIKAEFGIYAESSSNTAAGALTLMSYGVYRRWRESKAIPSGLVSYMWSGRTGEFGYEKSEAWANQVEKEQFSDTDAVDSTGAAIKEKNDAYVETGIQGGVAGKVGKKFGNTGAKMEASAKFGGGRRYNQESIERVKGKGNLGERNQAGDGSGDAVMGSGAQKLLADDTFFFEIAGEFEVTPLSGGVKLMGKFARPASATYRKEQAAKKARGEKNAQGEEITDDKWDPETIELSADFGFTIPAGGAGSDMASKILRPVATSLASLPGFIRTLIAKKKGELAHDKKARGTGTALDVAQSSVATFGQYVKDFGEPDNFTGMSTDLTEAAGPTTTGGLKIGVSIGFDFLEKELAIEFSTTQSIELEIPLFFEGSIEKSKRIVAIKFPGPKVS